MLPAGLPPAHNEDFFDMELFTDQAGDEGLPGRERCLAMISVMIATAMAVFDGSIVNIALPPIAQTLNVSTGEAVWVANGYLLSVAVTLAAFSALARRTGFRAQFTVGIAVFTLASLGCALSTSLPWLIAMRVLQGIGGAATLSIAPAIHRSIFPTRLLGRILGLNALLVATSSAVAPLLGGTLLAALSWQWLFAINVTLGIAGTMLAVAAPANAEDAAAGALASPASPTTVQTPSSDEPAVLSNDELGEMRGGESIAVINKSSLPSSS